MSVNWYKEINCSFIPEHWAI